MADPPDMPRAPAVTGPETPAWPAYTCQVASLEMPLGATLLTGLFAHWKLPIIDPWGLSTKALYRRAPDGSVHLPAHPTGFETAMPLLATRKVLTWNEAVVPMFHHQAPSEAPPLRKVIWVLRDPRDALYSDWRRELDGYNRFEDYLSGNWRKTGRTPITMFESFHRAWLAAERDHDLLRVPFEGLKTQPVAMARRIATHLDLPIDEAVLAQAGHHMDFERARSVESELPDALRSPLPFHRAGKVDEWRERWRRDALDGLPPSFRELILELGYPDASS